MTLWHAHPPQPLCDSPLGVYATPVVAGVKGSAISRSCSKPHAEGCKYRSNLLSFCTVCCVLVIPVDEGHQVVLCEEPHQVAAEHGGGAPQSSKVSP